MKKHDESYRLLFSIPRMIVEFLRGFFGQAWVDRVDFEIGGLSNHAGQAS
jgi:hypothetical protein